jgi:hypothetical protein
MSTDTKDIDFSLLSTGEIERIVDKGLRHKAGRKPHDYLEHWLYIGRHFGYATQDDSWGEFEKEFAIIIRRLVVAERNLKALSVVTRAGAAIAARDN